MSDKAMVHSGASASIPVEGGAVLMLEKAARALAAAMGYDFDDAFDDKSAWIKAHGDNGRGFVDINEPFKCDFVDGVRAVLMAIRDPSEEFMRHMYPDPTHQGMVLTRQGDRSRRAGRLQISHLVDHILNEAKQ